MIDEKVSAAFEKEVNSDGSGEITKVEESVNEYFQSQLPQYPNFLRIFENSEGLVDPTDKDLFLNCMHQLVLKRRLKGIVAILTSHSNVLKGWGLALKIALERLAEAYDVIKKFSSKEMNQQSKKYILSTSGKLRVSVFVTCGHTRLRVLSLFSPSLITKLSEFVQYISGVSVIIYVASTLVAAVLETARVMSLDSDVIDVASRVITACLLDIRHYGLV